MPWETLNVPMHGMNQGAKHLDIEFEHGNVVMEVLHNLDWLLDELDLHQVSVESERLEAICWGIVGEHPDRPQQIVYQGLIRDRVAQTGGFYYAG